MRLPRAACRQAVRVAALKRLFERKAGSQLLLRHELYDYIAEHANDAWMLDFTDAKGEACRKKLLTKGSNIRASDPFLLAWEAAIAEAFGGLRIEQTVGSKVAAKPNGWWTTELYKM